MIFETEAVAGVPSFCPAAAELGIALTEGHQPLTVIPAQNKDATGLIGADGTKVIMKSGKKLLEIKEMLKNNAGMVCAVENCGLHEQRIYRTIDEMDGFSNGTVSEITVTDFDGNEELFRKWKRLSDKYYIDERDLMYRISYKDVSINELEETDLTHLPSMEEVLVMREDDVEFTEELHEFLATLSDTQRRRLELRAFHGKSQSEIAEIEHIGQPRVHKSFVQIP